MQSIDSLRELNVKLLAEIAELRKENAEIPELREKLLRFAEVEAENARLKQIMDLKIVDLKMVPQQKQGKSPIFKWFFFTAQQTI